MRAVKVAFAWCFVCAAFGSVRMAQLHPSLVFASLSLAATIVFGRAWWTILRANTSSRRWGQGASVASLVLAVLLMGHHPLQLLSLASLALATGIAGLILFSLSDTSPAPTPKKAVEHPPLPGDGTNVIINRIIPLIGAAAAIEARSYWSRWADAHHMATGGTLGIYLQFLLAVLLVILIHEGGHALGGGSSMKLIHFVVGPFRWQRIGEKWRFEFRPATLLAFPGGTAVVPSDLNNFRHRKIVQVAAGPVASVISGLVAAAAVFTAPGHAWAADWRVFSYFATISLVVGLLNFIPFKMGRGYSDGAKLYQLRSEGLWASYHRLLGLISSTKVTQNRPRDFDIETVERAAGTIARGVDELNMHLCAYAFYLDKGQLEPAREALARAERLCQESSIEVPEDRYAEFVFAIAFLRRDAAAARRWWERMVARDSFQFNEDHWNSRCALLLSENRLQEALEVWKKADAWARQLPKAGAWDAQRHAVQLLGRALSESLATAV
jgi:hypothetical protein